MSNSLYNSYFDTVSTERKAPSKQKNQQTEPPRKLSKSFTRQVAKTLGKTSGKKSRRKSKKEPLTKRRRPSARMSKRAAADAEGSLPKDKKIKTNALPSKEKDKDGQAFWEISGKRRLQLSEFKGTSMVGIREFYEKDGQALPGKKGISMTIEQFNTVIGLLPQLEKELGKSGIQLSRPKYDGAEQDDGEGEDEEEEDAGSEAGEDESGAGAEES